MDWKELREISVRSKIQPKTPGQATYVEALKKYTITICSGPAGSGKTFLSALVALQYLQAGKIKKIILTRPLVTCGKGVGFLPGDLSEKVHPYMRPLLDILEEFLGRADLEKKIQAGVIEIVPLDLMRGLTLKESFIICDEAQNADYDQLHMFLTRFGLGAKVVVTGDTTQRDIQGNSLAEVMRALEPVREIAQIKLTHKDVVRHPLIKKNDKALLNGKVGVDLSMESWYKDICPSCKEILWWSNGDESDLTGFDVETIECWNCKTRWDIDGPDLVRSTSKFGDETYPTRV